MLDIGDERHYTGDERDNRSTIYDKRHEIRGNVMCVTTVCRVLGPFRLWIDFSETLWQRRERRFRCNERRVCRASRQETSGSAEPSRSVRRGRLLRGTGYREDAVGLSGPRCFSRKRRGRWTAERSPAPTVRSEKSRRARSQPLHNDALAALGSWSVC